MHPSATTVVLLLATLQPLSLGAQAPTDSATIHERSRQFSRAYERGDVETIVGLYTDDAVIFPERSDMLPGREAIRRYWSLRPGSRVTRHVATPTRIVVRGDIAHDYGNYEVSGVRDGQPWGPFLGKYVIVWRREPQGWRMVLDIWNSRPQPPQ